MTTNHLYYKKIERKPCTYKTTFSTEYFRGKSKVLMCFGFLIIIYSVLVKISGTERESREFRVLSTQHTTQRHYTRRLSLSRATLPACLQMRSALCMHLGQLHD